MTFDEKLVICYKMIEHLKYNQMYDDVKQEIALLIWENQENDDLKGIVMIAGKRIFGGEKKHKIVRVSNVRMQNGEEIEFDPVDERTIEQGEVRKSPVTDEMRETVAKMAECNDLIKRIFKRKKISNIQINMANYGFSASIKNFQKQCFNGMLKNVRTNTNV